MILYTIGYGGWKVEDFLKTLHDQGIQAVVDVRIRPDKAYSAVFAKASSPEKGIEGILKTIQVPYYSLIELGNPFINYEDAMPRYRKYFEKAGDLLTESLQQIPQPFCLLCAEHAAQECHRSIIADHLSRQGWTVQHLE